MPFSVLWGIRPNFSGLSPSYGQVAYALRTRAPVATKQCKHYFMLPLDLHVLSLPLAFILSQDQTLHCKKKKLLNLSSNLKGIVFEISLLAKRRKKLIQLLKYLKERILFDWAVALIFLFSLSPRLRRESGCKGKVFFSNHQIFWKLFSKKFSEPLFQLLTILLGAKPGAKIKQVF